LLLLTIDVRKIHRWINSDNDTQLFSHKGPRLMGYLRFIVISL